MFKSINFLREKSRAINTSPLEGEVGASLRVRGITNTATSTKPTPLAPVILGLVPRILFQQGTTLVNNLALLLHKCWLREDSWDKPKNDWCLKRRLSAFCMFFKYPSPDTFVLPSPSRGEGWHRPWCDKILGTGPSMTGGRGAGFVRLLRSARNDVVNDTPHSALPRHSLPHGAREYGRSMIEMLGVLAIIGVLSVGGIAGYSKAMEKFKINKLISEYNQLIFGLLEHQNNFPVPETSQNINETILALNLVPSTWKINNEMYMEDSYGNFMYARIDYSTVFVRRYAFVLDLNLGGVSLDANNNEISDNFPEKLCTEFFQNIVVPMHSVLEGGYVYKVNMDMKYRRYGDAFCGNGRLCIRDMTVSDIKNECSSCDKKRRCNITMVF